VGPDGDELFYLRPVMAGQGQLMRVTVTPDAEFTAISASNPQTLAAKFDLNADTPSYSISPDGQKFVRLTISTVVSAAYAAGDVSTSATFTVIENWFEELNRLAPSSQE